MTATSERDGRKMHYEQTMGYWCWDDNGTAVGVVPFAPEIGEMEMWADPNEMWKCGVLPEPQSILVEGGVLQLNTGDTIMVRRKEATNED